MIFFNKVITTSFRIRRILNEADLERQKGNFVDEKIYKELKTFLDKRFLFIVVYPISV